VRASSGKGAGTAADATAVSGGGDDGDVERPAINVLVVWRPCDGGCLSKLGCGEQPKVSASPSSSSSSSNRSAPSRNVEPARALDDDDDDDDDDDEVVEEENEEVEVGC